MKNFVVSLLFINTFPITSAPCPLSAVHKNKAWHTYSKSQGQTHTMISAICITDYGNQETVTEQSNNDKRYHSISSTTLLASV